MAPYQYCDLDIQKHEFRLLHLLPGKFDDRIKIQVWTTPLIVPPARIDPRISLDELNKTLPKLWGAYKTVHGRYIFENGETEETFWSHPDPSFDSSRLGTTFEDPPDDYEPRYEALSYTWGPPESCPELAFVQPISNTSTQADPVTLPLRRNLAVALRHIRFPKATRTLWIDALCINQDNIPERNEQVKRMTDIYRLADRVVIWLGPRETNSEAAMKMLDHLGAQIVLLENEWCHRAPEATDTQWYRRGNPIPISQEILSAMHHLLNRGWFDRVWVTQEGQMANSRSIVMCGDDSMPWPHMQAAIIGLWSNNVSGRSPELLELFTRLMHFAFRQCGRQLFGLITRNAYRLCADPRDKIYGILGLAHPTITAQIKPNYSLTVTDVYKEVFLTYSKFSSRLGMLRECNLGLRNIDGPSWVPDWSTVTNTVIGKRDLILYDTSSACMDYLPPNTLKVAGVHCGVIHHIGSATSSQPKEVLEVIRQWEPENLQMASYPTGESMLDAFVLTLRGCHVKERFPDYGYPTTESWKDTYLSKISRRTSSAQIEDAMKDSTVVQTVKNCSYQRFLWADAGYFGLGPVNAQPGE